MSIRNRKRLVGICLASAFVLGAGTSCDVSIDNVPIPPSGGNGGTGPSGGGGGVSLGTGHFETVQDTPVTVTLSFGGQADTDPTFTIISDPLHGQLGAIHNADSQTATVTYTPEPDYVGDDTFVVSAAVGTDTATALVTITVFPLVLFDVDILDGSPPLLVTGTAFTFTGDPLPPGTYTWTFGDTSDSGSEDTHAVRTHVFNNPGILNVTLTLTLAAGTGPISCVNSNTNTDTARVIVNPAVSGHIRTANGTGVPGVSLPR
ncbi:MAG: PKD domain-containing protein, partial [Phycisphaerae bacterium]